MLDGMSVAGTDGDDDSAIDDGMLLGASVSDGDGDKVLPVLGLVVGYRDSPRVGCDVDVGNIVISVGGGVKGLVGVGLLVDVIVGILLVLLLVGPNVKVGVNELVTEVG
jgi:hypothetical protein